MGTTDPNERVVVSVLKIPHNNTWAIMISYRLTHAILPWAYTSEASAMEDASNLMEGLIANGFTELGDDQMKFDFEIPDQEGKKGGIVVDL